MADPEISISGELVICNDDHLIQILVRLPALSLILFKSVSKRWLSLIKDSANLAFRRNPDPTSALFLEKFTHKSYDYLNYEFVPLDIPRIPFRRKTHYYKIVDSCNGLLLCRACSEKLYVDNPSFTRMFKRLPQPNSDSDSDCLSGGLKLAFDPTKSPHYKVIHAKLVGIYPDDHYFQLNTYSSKTGKWSNCGSRFPNRCFVSLCNGVYWNDAIYWINNGEVLPDDIFQVDIKNERPVLTSLRIPSTLYRNVCYECRLFESRGCLLLVGMGDDQSRHLTIYEKRNEYSEWSLKYIVNVDDIIKPFYISQYPKVSCIVLGEREEDSFLVTELEKKVRQYKIVSKTLSTISYFGPNDSLLKCFQFIPSLAHV